MRTGIATVSDQKDYAVGGYWIHTNAATGSGYIVRFAGSPGEHHACDFGPDCHFKTASEFLDHQNQQDSEQMSAELQCPQM